MFDSYQEPATLPTCPICRAGIDQDLLPGAFVCPECGGHIQTSKSYFRVMFLVALYLTAMVLESVGASAQELIVGLAIGVWPVFLVVAAVNSFLFPADLEVVEHFPSVVAPPTGSGTKGRR